MCVHRELKSGRHGASMDASERAELRNVIGVLVMIGLNE